MRFLLFAGAVAAALFGLLVMNVAKSAIHEIEVYLLLLIASVLFAGGAILHALVQIKDRLDASRPNNLPPSPNP